MIRASFRCLVTSVTLLVSASSISFAEGNKWAVDYVTEENIHGANITVPFKNKIIPLLDSLTSEADRSQSVNTIYKMKNKIIGDNTDIEGFKIALEKTKQTIENKTAKDKY